MDLECYFTLIHAEGICESEPLPPPCRWDVTLDHLETVTAFVATTTKNFKKETHSDF